MERYNQHIETTLQTIINGCLNTETNEVEITLPDNTLGKEVFLKVSDETKWNGRLYEWSFTLYDTGKMGERSIENNTAIRKHKLIKK